MIENVLHVFIDVESYYDNEYSLTKLSPVEYILDRRWQTLGCAVAVGDETPQFLFGDEIATFLRQIKQPYVCVSHNATFDACVLAYRYDIHPPMLACTLSMSRALLAHELRSLSLGNVLKALKLPDKGDFVQKLKGKRLDEITKDIGLTHGMVDYAIRDVGGCRDIYNYLAPAFPTEEVAVMDRVIRMATQPVLRLDMKRLLDYYAELQFKREDLLSEVSCERTQLMSNPQFAELLKALGVDPPMKVSPTTGKMTYAFARNDSAFTDLLEHDDPRVVTLVNVRLGIKSTIEESRTKRLIGIGLATGGTLPVPLNYSGAHTHRFSGAMQLNMQNLSARKSKELRKCIVAPEGYTIVAVDASQIEARLTAWLAGQVDLLDQFEDHEDVYSNFASSIFGVELAKVTRAQRFVGKTCILGLGFGMSAEKLYRTIIILAREQGIEIEITQSKCKQWVEAYRSKFYKIVHMWDRLDGLLRMMAMGTADTFVGPCRVEASTITLPSGLKLQYHGLYKDEDDNYAYRRGAFVTHIYGGKLLENLVQALDRQHVIDAGLTTESKARKAGIEARILLNIHDENVYCVPDDQAYDLAEIALQVMRTRPKWGAGLPLDAEVKLGKNFGEMKSWE